MKLPFLAELPAEMFSDVEYIRMPVVNPAPLLSNGFQGVGRCSPDFLRSLESIALLQLEPGVLQESVADLGVAFHS